MLLEMCGALLSPWVKKVFSYPNNYDQYEFQQLHEENQEENVPN